MRLPLLRAALLAMTIVAGCYHYEPARSVFRETERPVPATSLQLPQPIYTEVESFQGLRAPVVAALLDQGIADRGQPFNPTDEPGVLPHSRFVRGGVASQSVLVLWERGGVAPGLQVAVLEVRDGTVSALFLGHGPRDARSLAEIVRYLEERPVENLLVRR